MKGTKYEINAITFINFILFLIICGLYLADIVSFKTFVFAGLVLANYGTFDNSFKKLAPAAQKESK